MKKVGADMSPVFVYIKPPTFETLEQRLRDRQTENKDSLEKRLSQAKVHDYSVDFKMLYPEIP